MHDKRQKAPAGKSMSTVRVGEKGQIVIPKDMRDMFDIQPGDTLLLLADIHQGIGIVKNDVLRQFASAALRVPAVLDEEEEKE